MLFSFIQRRRFQRLYSDIERRVKIEKKTDASWLMGYLQGRGNRKLTGFQVAALIDLLLIYPDVPVEQEENIDTDVLPGAPEQKPVADRLKFGPFNIGP